MAKRSLLSDLQERQGAIFAAQDGWLMPEHFGDPVGEYESVGKSAGLFDLADRAMLQFTGDDRLSYLQGMLSNDLRSPNVVVVYTAEVVGGTLTAADESTEAAVFAPTAVPWHELAFDSTRHALDDYIRSYLK